MFLFADEYQVPTGRFYGVVRPYLYCFKYDRRRCVDEWNSVFLILFFAFLYFNNHYRFIQT